MKDSANVGLGILAFFHVRGGTGENGPVLFLQCSRQGILAQHQTIDRRVKPEFIFRNWRRCLIGGDLNFFTRIFHGAPQGKRVHIGLGQFNAQTLDGDHGGLGAVLGILKWFGWKYQAYAALACRIFKRGVTGVGVELIAHHGAAIVASFFLTELNWKFRDRSSIKWSDQPGLRCGQTK